MSKTTPDHKEHLQILKKKQENATLKLKEIKSQNEPKPEPATSRQWKLTYFDGRGRAELLRLIMAYSGRKYTDHRIRFDQWAEVKTTTPFSALPVLEAGGRVYGQAIAIAQFLSREAGLYTRNTYENLQIDQILMCREDILVPEAKIKFEKDDVKKAEMLDDFEENLYPKYFNYFSTAIRDNPAKSGFVVGKRLTLADVSIFDMTEWIVENRKSVIDKYPEVKALRAKVADTKGIKKYLEQRKKTPF